MVDQNSPIRDVRRWKRGERLKSRKLNEAVDAINRIPGGVRPPRQLPARPLSKGSTTKVQQFKVVLEDGDFLVCVPYDGLTPRTDNPLLIAKPYLLRKTPFDGLARNGVTYTYTGVNTRTATDGVDNETQLITPSYVADDIIYAVRNITGKTATLDTEENTLEWLDLNADGRAWAKQT